MQNPSRPGYDLFAPLQPIEPIPNWSWKNRTAASNKGAMEIGGLLSGNRRHNANADVQMRQRMQQGYAMNHYAMGHNNMTDSAQHYNMANSTALGFPHMTQTQHPQIMPHPDRSPPSEHSPTDRNMRSSRVKTEVAAKNFNCSTCPKKFARRSDLARHERIHTGIKPHRCDFPNCGKTFIQRSALTVHSRVHTGEKPHLCEICSKPFSDSSSLARHRRTHSGKRPYRCPFANCQKTFTRRTTLTRHQNHHSGTVEQAAAETQAKLSISTGGHSFDDNHSDAHSSRTCTTSPRENSSISPNDEMPHFQAQLHHQSSNLRYMNQNQTQNQNHHSTMPQHIRNEYSLNIGGRQNHIPSTSSIPFVNMSIHNQNQSHLQRHITSNPSSHTYVPPQPLEPPATSGTASNNDSPHLSAMAWPSPNGALPSPSAMDFSNYPDPGFNHNMFFVSNNVRRPQSTEPEDWSLRSRHSNTQPQFPSHMSLGNDWSIGMSMNVPDVKSERTYAM